MKRITATFLDEITHDIPSQNWGREDWAREFGLYRRIGIDTVVLIRSGYRERCVFAAKSVPDLLPVREDLGRMFLDLAEENGLVLYWGTYDSGVHWMRQSWWREVELNQRFLDEVAERYGSSPAFGGWYLAHEAARHENHIVELFNGIGGHCRSLKDVPVLISPYPMGTKQFAAEHAFTLTETREHWERVFAEAQGAFDICAFQDGQVQYSELEEFHQMVHDIAAGTGVEVWANIESFDRDMPIKFPPADWRYLRTKMEVASRYAARLMTFEFAHFMSPHSCYPSARNLFARYCEEFEIQTDGQN
ncbi:MAG: DUF4434 domain-containing protein [Fimbriimonadaceae bacterium]|nr:DUF4434 domain-containing protein [Fimbriimonadaceae bacterium]